MPHGLFGGGAGWLPLLTGLLTILWLLSEIWIRVYARSQGAPKRVGRQRDRGSGLLIVVCLVGILAIILVYDAVPFWGFFPVWVRAAGDLGMVVGIALRVWAIKFLGRYFTGIVTLQSGHHVISDGPYAKVRHPSYTGALITLYSFPLAIGNPLGVLASLVLLPVCFGYRMKVEEEMLLSGLGEEYRQYMQRTRRLVPGVY